MHWWGVFTDFFPHDDPWVFSHPRAAAPVVSSQGWGLRGAQILGLGGERSRGDPRVKPGCKHGQELQLPAGMGSHLQGWHLSLVERPQGLPGMGG